LRFQSFLESVKPGVREFSVVYGVHATPQGVYFQANERIFFWQNNGLKAWRAKTAFLASFWIDATLFVYQQGIGLMVIKGDSLQVAPGGEQLANHRVFAMLLSPAGKIADPTTKSILVGLNQEGLFLYDGASFRPFTGEANVSCGVTTSAGSARY
jgi:hypothetical protein